MRQTETSGGQLSHLRDKTRCWYENAKGAIDGGRWVKTSEH